MFNPSIQILLIQIGNSIVSLDLFEKQFECDIVKCKGECCVYGDSGAPLEPEEGIILEKIYQKVKPVLRQEGIEAIEEIGTSMTDSDGDLVTPLIRNRECAYTLVEEGIYKCGIERAYQKNKISFRKPSSCHLFPVKIKKYSGFDGVNYENWKICEPARILGEKKAIPVYRFLKDALIRKFGKKWYRELEKVAAELIRKSF